MTDFFGSVRNIELMKVNESTLSVSEGAEEWAEDTPISTSKYCQPSLPVSLSPLPLAGVCVHCVAHRSCNTLFLLGGGNVECEAFTG